MNHLQQRRKGEKNCPAGVGNCGEKFVILENLLERMRFTGCISAKLDAKGRAFFPASFRRLLSETDSELVLKRDVYAPCLVVYPQAAWSAELDALRRRLNRWNPQEAMLFRQFMADAELFTLDSNGRFLIPRRLLDWAGISRDLTFVGVDDRIELWESTRAAAPFLPAADYSAAMERVMGRPGAASPADTSIPVAPGGLFVPEP